MSLSASRPTLYVSESLESQRVTALFAEKGSPVPVVYLDHEVEKLLNAADVGGRYPVLVDRGLVVFGSPLDEYIHERWPGPQLLPIDPIHRAQARMLENWVREWYDADGFAKTKHLREVESVFDANNKFFFGPQVSVVDVALIPLLRSFPYKPLSPAFGRYIERLKLLGSYRAAA